MSRRPLATPARPRAVGVVGIIVVLMVVTMLAGCGKKGNPTAAPPVTYPRVYPNPNPQPQPQPPSP